MNALSQNGPRLDVLRIFELPLEGADRCHLCLDVLPIPRLPPAGAASHRRRPGHTDPSPSTAAANSLRSQDVRGSVGTAPSKLDVPVAPFRHRKPASPRVIANPSPNSSANANLRVLVCRALLDVARNPEGETRSSAGPGRRGYHRERHKGSRAQQIHGELRPRSQQIHRQVITHAVA